MELDNARVRELGRAHKINAEINRLQRKLENLGMGKTRYERADVRRCREKIEQLRAELMNPPLFETAAASK